MRLVFASMAIILPHASSFNIARSIGLSTSHRNTPTLLHSEVEPSSDATAGDPEYITAIIADMGPQGQRDLNIFYTPEEEEEHYKKLEEQLLEWKRENGVEDDVTWLNGWRD